MTLSTIGRFEIQRPLGSGSFATVWLARDAELDGWVAIKLLAENWSFNDDARRRFLEEARALRRLDDDRIVRVYDVGSLPDGRPYIVMEYADRGSLEDRMRLRAQLGQAFSVQEAVALGMEIAACLAAVHDLRIVHRDVKPSNILFRGLSPERQQALLREARAPSRERTLLGDFGIARRLEGPLGHTMVVGSPQYMAPEQADPQRARLVDQRSDLYSAAVILYELLGGRLPFATDSLSELGQVPAGARPPDLNGLRPDVPPRLAAVVARALSREPAARFATAWEWREALASSVREPPPFTAGAPGPPSTVARPRAAGVPRGGTGTIPIPTRRGTSVLDPRRSSPRPPAPGARRAEAQRGSVRRPPASVGQDRSPEPHPEGPPVPGQEGPPVLRPEAQPVAPGETRAVPDLHVRVPAFGAMLASVITLAAVVLPWAVIRNGGGPVDRLGLAFRGGSIAVLSALALALAGVRLWRARRRWAAKLFALVGILGGLAGMVVAGYELVVVTGHVPATLGLADPTPGAASAGYGLHVTMAGALLGFAASWGALRRLNREGSLERANAAIRSARGAG